MSTFNAGAIEANLTLGRSSWTKDLQKTKKEIADLEKKSISIGVDLDDDNARVAMDNLELFLEDLESKTYAPKADLDISDANATLEAFEAMLERMEMNTLQIQADADIDNALVQLNELENLIDVLEADDLVIHVRIDADQAKLELIDLSVHIQRLSLAGIGIDVDIHDYAKAIAQLVTLDGAVSVLDGRDIDIPVNVDRAALAGLVGSGASGGGGGSLGLLKILIYAILLLSPVLAVAMSSLTAAVVAFAAAMAGAAGAAIVLGAGLAGLVQRFKDTDPSDYTPAMQMFADSIDAVKDAWSEFLDGIEDTGFGLMAQALELVADVLPTLVPLFNTVAEAMSGVLDGIGAFVDSPEYDEMIAFFSGFGVDMLVSFLKIGGNLIRFFGRLFQAIEPFAREMMGGLEDVTAGWAAWADDLENNQSFQDFMDNASKYGPMVLDMLGSLIQAFMALGDALEPFAGPMLEGLTFLFDAIANAPTELLTALIAGIAGLWLGMSVIAPLIGAVSGGIAALAGAVGLAVGPFLLIVAAIGLVAFAIYQLWTENETFRTAVIDAWNAIYETMAPIIEDIVALFMENWPAIKEFVLQLWEDLKVIITEAMIILSAVIGAAMAYISFMWDKFGKNILTTITIAFNLVAGIVRGVVTQLKGYFQIISGILTGDWSKAWEGMKNVVRGAGQVVGAIAKAIKDSIVNMASQVRTAFNTLTGWLGGLGGRIGSAVSGMWNSVWTNFKSVLNQVIGAWNNLSFSVDIPDKIPGLPDKWTVNTPNVDYLAEGGYITDPGLFVVGEGKDNEIVAPEPVMEKIVRDNSGANLDYGTMAAAIASALAAVMDRFNPVTREDIERLIEAAGFSLTVDARGDTATVGQMASAIGFELRRLGFGGKDNV